MIEPVTANDRSHGGSEQRSADVVASATLAVQPDANLAEQPPGILPTDRLEILADRGYWYDLIAELSTQIGANPTDHSHPKFDPKIDHPPPRPAPQTGEPLQDGHPA